MSKSEEENNIGRDRGEVEIKAGSEREAKEGEGAG